MKTSLSGTLTKWDTSLSGTPQISGTLSFAPKPKMNLIKWDTLLFETSLADVFITFQGKLGGFPWRLGIIKPMSLMMKKNQQKNVKEKKRKK